MKLNDKIHKIFKLYIITLYFDTKNHIETKQNAFYS